MPHIDDGTLHALLDGALRAEEPDRADRLEAHLEACADCRARLEQAAALRDEVAEVLAALDAGLTPAPEPEEPAALDTTPDFQDVIDRAATMRSETDREADASGAGGRVVDDEARRIPEPAGDSRTAGLRRQYRWTRGLAWAATIVVALGTGYLVRDLVGPTGEVPRERMLRTSAPLDDRAPALEAEGEAPAGAPAGVESPGAESPRAESPRAEPPGVEPADDVTGAAEGVARGAAAETPRTQAAEGRDAPVTTQAPAERTEPVPTAEGETVRQDLTDEGVDRAAADAVANQRAAAQPAGEAAEEAPAQLAPQAGRVLEVSGEQPRAEWRAVPLRQAEVEAGPVFLLPRAEVVSTELGVPRAIRTTQRLPGGVLVSVLQVPAYAVDQPGGVVADAAEAGPATGALAPLIGVDLDSASATVTEPATVSAERDGVVLTVTGQLPPDILQALVNTAEPRDP